MLSCAFAAMSLLSMSVADGSWQTFTVDGRDIDAHVPDCVDESSPVILSLHAWASNKETQKTTDNLATKQRPGCALVLYPQGISRGELFGVVGWSWNAGGCCPNANKDAIDDVEFLDKVVASAADIFGADGDTTFVIGLSNGGMMTNRLACSLDRVKAAVMVSGPLVNGSADIAGTEMFPCERRVPILHFHGTTDPVVPITGCNKTNGGMVCQSLMRLPAFASLPDVQETMKSWRARNGADQASPVTTFVNGSVSCTSWAGSALDNVTLCTIEGEGHAWPGSCPATSMVPMFRCTRDIDASEQALAFFNQQLQAQRSAAVVL